MNSRLFRAYGLLILLSVPAVSNADKPLQIKLLSSAGSTRAARYNSSNKIVTFRNKTHIAWLDSVSKTMIATFDHESQKWSEAIHVGTGQDNHGGPALACDSQGFLHLVFGPHGNSPFQHCRSLRPNDSSEWLTLKTFGSNATYPSLVCDSKDTLHIIYRGGKQPRQPYSMLYQSKPRDGSWTEPIALATYPAGWNGYTHYHQSLTIARDDALHVAFNIYYGDRALDVGYLKSIDRGKTWLQANGTPAVLPVTTGSDALIVESQRPLSVINAVCDKSGTAWLAIDTQGEYSVRCYRNGQWKVLSMNEHLKPEQRNQARSWGAFTIADDGRMFVPLVIGKSVRGGTAGDLWLLASDRQKTRFKPHHIIQPDPAKPHTGATMERFAGHNPVSEPWMLFSTGLKGTGNVTPGVHHLVRAVQTAH